MTLIGVLHLSSIITPPGATQNPGATIVSHISDLYPTQLHNPYHIDHRLFISTSSLLPANEPTRSYTQIFTSSHSPQRSFISTVSPSTTTRPETITIPTTASLDAFTQLLSQKLQPQWAPRQFLTSENGASLTLPVKDEGKWQVSVGDLRLAQSRGTGSTPGHLRGVLVELRYEAAEEVELGVEGVREKYERLFRGVLKGLCKGLKLELKLDDAKVYLAKTSDATGDLEGRAQWQSPAGREIAELYMEVLRGSRG